MALAYTKAWPQGLNQIITANFDLCGVGFAPWPTNPFIYSRQSLSATMTWDGVSSWTGNVPGITNYYDPATPWNAIPMGSSFTLNIAIVSAIPIKTVSGGSTTGGLPGYFELQINFTASGMIDSFAGWQLFNLSFSGGTPYYKLLPYGTNIGSLSDSYFANFTLLMLGIPITFFTSGTANGYPANHVQNGDFDNPDQFNYGSFMINFISDNALDFPPIGINNFSLTL